MINRVLIRLKTVQVIYSYYQNGGQKPETARLELAQSLDSAYYLYKTLLFLPVALTRIARKSVAKQKRMGGRVSRKEELLAGNRLALVLENNAELTAFVEDTDCSWLSDSDLLKEIYPKVIASDQMEEYSQIGKYDLDSDRDFLKKIYKIFFQDNDDFDALLEEQNIFWNGDRELIDSFVLKTLKGLKEQDSLQQPLQKEFKDEEDRKFAFDLLKYGLETQAEREVQVSANCRRWDPSRLAFLDVLIIQVALAEMLYIPGIPVKVTINEYVELAKLLSTPSSGAFVNGMLDTIAKDLVSCGKLNKEL